MSDLREATTICDHCDGTGRCWESPADDFSESYDYDCQNCDGNGTLPIVAPIGGQPLELPPRNLRDIHGQPAWTLTDDE